MCFAALTFLGYLRKHGQGFAWGLAVPTWYQIMIIAGMVHDTATLFGLMTVLLWLDRICSILFSILGCQGMVCRFAGLTTRVWLSRVSFGQHGHRFAKGFQLLFDLRQFGDKPFVKIFQIVKSLKLIKR